MKVAMSSKEAKQSFLTSTVVLNRSISVISSECEILYASESVLLSAKRVSRVISISLNIQSNAAVTVLKPQIGNQDFIVVWSVAIVRCVKTEKRREDFLPSRVFVVFGSFALGAIVDKEEKNKAGISIACGILMFRFRFLIIDFLPKNPGPSWKSRGFHFIFLTVRVFPGLTPGKKNTVHHLLCFYIILM